MAKKISKKERQARREQRKNAWQNKPTRITRSDVNSAAIAQVLMCGYDVWTVVYLKGGELMVTCHGIIPFASEDSVARFIKAHTPTSGPMIALKMSQSTDIFDLDFFDDAHVIKCTQRALKKIQFMGQDICLGNFDEFKASFDIAA